MNLCSARRLAQQRRPGSCRAAIPGSYCKAPTANSWCPTRVNAARCGHPVSGRAPCSSKVRPSAFGGARGMCSRSSHGNVFPTHSAMRSKRRRGQCPCPGLPDPWMFAGITAETRLAFITRSCLPLPFSPQPNSEGHIANGWTEIFISDKREIE